MPAAGGDVEVEAERFMASADLFDAGNQRGDVVNVAAATPVVRTQMEAVGQLCWLFDPAITADDRCCRYLTWRFGDLAARRKLVVHVTATGHDLDMDAVAQENGRVETEVIDLALRAGWASRASGPHGDTFQHAQLIGVDNKPTKVPFKSELVGAAYENPSFYALTSSSAHSDRWAMWHGVEPVDDDPGPGMVDAHMAGFGLDPDLVIVVTCSSMLRPVNYVAQWNGDPIGRLATMVHRIHQKR